MEQGDLLEPREKESALEVLESVSGHSAEELLYVMGIQQAVPIDLAYIIERLGIELLFENSRDTKSVGSLFVDSNLVPTIKISHDTPIIEQRILMAYLLGIFIQDTLPTRLNGQPSSRYDQRGTVDIQRFTFADDPVQIAGKFFATNLLMPTKALAKYAEEGADRLAHRFMVPSQMIARQLEYLGL